MISLTKTVLKKWLKGLITRFNFFFSVLSSTETFSGVAITVKITSSPEISLNTLNTIQSKLWKSMNCSRNHFFSKNWLWLLITKTLMNNLKHWDSVLLLHCGHDSSNWPRQWCHWIFILIKNYHNTKLTFYLSTWDVFHHFGGSVTTDPSSSMTSDYLYVVSLKIHKNVWILVSVFEKQQ